MRDAIKQLAFLWGAIVLGTTPALATSIIQRSLDELLVGAELIFEGRVIDVQTVGLGRQIRTEVTFEILDVIKGEVPDTTVKLGFHGGTSNGRTLQIGGMKYPEEGEKGFYFVESLDREQIHPLYGWSQGHFLLVQDSQGIERVLTQDKQAVVDLDFTSKHLRRGLSQGVADGVVLYRSRAKLEPISGHDFKKALSARMHQQHR